MIFKNFQASVEVGGQPLEEYDVTQPSVFEKNCYIASEKGAVRLLWCLSHGATCLHVQQTDFPAVPQEPI